MIRSTVVLLGASLVIVAAGPWPLDANPTQSSAPSQRSGELSVSINGPGEAPRGGEITYNVNVANSGGSAQGVIIEFDGDRDTVFQGASGCRQDRRDIICEIGNLAAGANKSISLNYSLPEEELRCGEKVKARASVYMSERGRSRRQDRSNRLTATAICN